MRIPQRTVIDFEVSVFTSVAQVRPYYMVHIYTPISPYPLGTLELGRQISVPKTGQNMLDNGSFDSG